ncbi:unnamed protein product, partial [Mesorhabditis spiculigera]
MQCHLLEVGRKRCDPLEDASWIPRFRNMLEIWFKKGKSVSSRVRAIDEVTPDHEMFEQLKRKFAPIADPEPELRVRKLIPKEPKVYGVTYELLIVKSSADAISATFYPSLSSDESLPSCQLHHPYQLQFQEDADGGGNFLLFASDENSEQQLKWLTKKVFSALERWIDIPVSSAPMETTNALISGEAFASTYLQLKDDYGRQLCEIWPESTDPSKFVYEDCAIAAYLLETWRKRGKMPEYFLDLGCGNGLLVYLLNKAGVPGAGIDLKRRKIWDTLFKDTQLYEDVVDPRTIQGKPFAQKVDYLIGNHTDELTPWMPVMAARFNCDFFVIPCCPFDFGGKFNGKMAGRSTYSSYLQYLSMVNAVIGFEMDRDRLPIPSTKRKCFIGAIPSGGLPSDTEATISQLTQNVATFVPRPKIQKNSNCSDIPVEMRKRIALKLFDYLLTGRAATSTSGQWYQGSQVALAELFKLLTPEEVDCLRQQHGGLQTFIKNHHDVFHAVQGTVKIRDYRDARWRPNRKKFNNAPNYRKKAPCWMAAHHPDGCPLEEKDCLFNHEVPFQPLC